MTDPLYSAPRQVTGNSRILIVEDDEALRGLYVRWLSKPDYVVAAVGSGREAVDLVGTDSSGFDLVILDMVMDDMSGMHTFELMSQARPGIKVLLCSGYRIDRQVGIVLDAGAVGFLQKPFSREELCGAVAKALTDRSSQD